MCRSDAERDEQGETRIICHTGPLAPRNIGTLNGLNTPLTAAPVLTSIEQVVRRLRVGAQVSFRFEEFEKQHVLWQCVGTTAAIVQEHRDGQLRRLHLLSRDATGDVIWERQVNAADDDDGALLGLLVIVPAFTEWSDLGRGSSGTDC